VFAGWSVKEQNQPTVTSLNYDFTGLAGEVTSLTIACEVVTSYWGPQNTWGGSSVTQTDVWTTIDVSNLIGTAGTWDVPMANGVPATPTLPADLESALVLYGDWGAVLFPDSGWYSGAGIYVQYGAGVYGNLDHMTLTWAPGVTPFVPNQTPTPTGGFIP
jgi:hypothetical protein